MSGSSIHLAYGIVHVDGSLNNTASTRLGVDQLTASGIAPYLETYGGSSRTAYPVWD